MPKTASWFTANSYPVSRAGSGGRSRSAVGIAAYVTGERMQIECTGKWTKRNHPGDVLAWGVAAPAHAPAHFYDKAQLSKAWNEVERSETHKKAHMANHLVIALHRDWNDEQKADAMQAITAKLVDRYGFYATWAVHAPTGHGDERNQHGHIAYSMKRVTPDGMGKKIRELSDRKTSRAELVWMRKTVADTLNEKLEQWGFDERVTHESLAARGIDREGQVHLGNDQFQAELKGIPTPRGELNRAIKQRNALRDQIDAIGQEKTEASAELIDLHEERIRRLNPMDDATIESMAGREEAGYLAMEAQAAVLKGYLGQREKETQEAEREKERIQQEDRIKKAKDLPDSNVRHQLAAAEAGWNPRDPYGSLGRIAQTELAMMRRDCAELQAKVDAETDPTRRRAGELSIQIVTADYLAATSARLVKIGQVNTGRMDGDQAKIDMARERQYLGISAKLREERANLLTRRDSQTVTLNGKTVTHNTRPSQHYDTVKKAEQEASYQKQAGIKTADSTKQPATPEKPKEDKKEKTKQERLLEQTRKQHLTHTMTRGRTR